MLLTASSGRAESLTTWRPGGRLLLLRAIAHRVPELLALLDGGRLELGADDVPHRLDPVRHDLPLLAVPLLHERLPVALVVTAGHADRPGQALEAQLLEPLLGQVQVLHAP